MAPDEAATNVSSAAEAALEEFLEWVPDFPVKRAIGGFFRALISGLEKSNLVKAVKAVEGGSSLQINLHKRVIGTVATRSRVPAEWVLLPKIQVWIDDDELMGTKLRLMGIQVVPIEGAMEAWKIMAALFIEKQAETLDERRKVAWDWWNEEGRDKFEGTKLWRVVESLAQLGFGKVVPTYAKASLLLGCTLNFHQDMDTLHYRYNNYNGNGGNNSSHNGDEDIDVLGTLKPVAVACDPSSPEFNCDEDMKDDIGLGLWEETVSTPMKRMTAERCARSSLNYAALFCARAGQEKGASPASVQKLVTVARYFGGATKYDVIKGKASSWQYDDETYQMTGDNGRIVWRALDDDE
jgi:hypothetical protein